MTESRLALGESSIRVKAAQIICGLVAVSIFSWPTLAQETSAKMTSAVNMRLQVQLDKLEQGQQQIAKDIESLKALLEERMPNGRGPQPPTPPSKLVILGEGYRGENDATVAIIEYADFECPYCGQYERDTYPQIATNYIRSGKVKYFYRDLPLPMHPHATIAARAARCAGEQGKFWEMHDSLFANQNAIRDVDMPDRAQVLGLDSARFSECLSSNRYTDEIKQSVEEAQKMGIGGTPTFFVGKIGPMGEVINLKMIIGARPYETFKSAIDETSAAK